jgi:hypothetical protein
MPDNYSFKAQLHSLEISQAKTCTAVENLAEKVSDYINLDEARYEELIHARLRSTELLAEVTTQLKELKTNVDGFHSKCPNNSMITEVYSLGGQLRTQGWFVKGVLGVTIIALFGSLVGSLNSCQTLELDRPSTASTSE